MARRDETDPVKFSVDDLKVIVSAGMAISEARGLLEDGYSPEAVLELAELQAAQKSAASAAAMTDAAKAAADHTEKVRNPSNKTHPGISAFSYPEGDRERPKANVPFEFLYNGYPCHKFLETEHWREVELMTQVKPGEYTVVRSDFSEMKVKVTAERDANDKLTKVEVHFGVSREDKPKIPAKAVVLYQIVHAGTKPTRQLFVEGLNDWMRIVSETPVTA